MLSLMSAGLPGASLQHTGFELDAPELLQYFGLTALLPPLCSLENV